MSIEDAVKIIKAGGWGYSESMVTEANMMAIKALEKQIPQKVNINGFFYAGCPNCNKDLYHKYEFCPDCGQALDWSGAVE